MAKLFKKWPSMYIGFYNQKSSTFEDNCQISDDPNAGHAWSISEKMFIQRPSMYEDFYLQKSSGLENNLQISDDPNADLIVQLCRHSY